MIKIFRLTLRMDIYYSRIQLSHQNLIALGPTTIASPKEIL